MPIRRTKAELLGTIAADRRLWTDLVSEVGEGRMNEPGPMGNWTFKDLAAHLLAWRTRNIVRLQARANGGTLPLDPWPGEFQDDDQINAWIHERYRDVSTPDILRQMDQTFVDFAAAIGRLPDALIADPDAIPAFGGVALAEMDLFGHFRDEHEPSVRAWLASR
jgi:hypothetical protein